MSNAPVACRHGGARGIPSLGFATLNPGWAPTDNIHVDFNIRNLFDRTPYFDPVGCQGHNHRLDLHGRVFIATVRQPFFRPTRNAGRRDAASPIARANGTRSRSCRFALPRTPRHRAGA